jgi:hypothetical protein
VSVLERGSPHTRTSARPQQLESLTADTGLDWWRRAIAELVRELRYRITLGPAA